MWEYWPLFALGLLCGVAAMRVLAVMRRPAAPNPRADWADYQAALERRMKHAKPGDVIYGVIDRHGNPTPPEIWGK